MINESPFAIFYANEMRDLEAFLSQYQQEHPEHDLADPLSKALLSGVAFLNARTMSSLVESKQHLAQALLQAAYPHLSNPAYIPVIMFQAVLSSSMKDIYQLRCRQKLTIEDDYKRMLQFRVGYDTELLPIDLVEVQWTESKALFVAGSKQTKQSTLTLRFKAFDNVAKFADIPFSQLRLFLGEDERQAPILYNLLLKHCVSLRLGRSTRDSRAIAIPTENIVQTAFSQQEFLTYPKGAEHSYRLLSEFGKYPEKYRFIDIQGLSPYLSEFSGKEFTLSFKIELPNEQPTFEPTIDDFLLNIVPLVNLFEVTLDAKPKVTPAGQPIPQTLTVDAPEDCSVFFIESVTEHSAEGQKLCEPLSHPVAKDSNAVFWQEINNNLVSDITFYRKDNDLARLPESFYQAQAWCYHYSIDDDDDWSEDKDYLAQFEEGDKSFDEPLMFRYQMVSGIAKPDEAPWPLWRLLKHLQYQNQSILNVEDKKEYLKSIIDLAGILTINTICSGLAKKIVAVHQSEHLVTAVIANQYLLKQRQKMVITIKSDCKYSDALLEGLLTELINYNLFEPMSVQIVRQTVRESYDES